MMMTVARALALGALVALPGARASGSCGGFDLDDHGQAGQCLDDEDSRNGCYNIYGHPNSCWYSVPMSSCCGHGQCSGEYDRYNSHCTCEPGYSGDRCDQGSPAQPPPPPPPPPPSPPPAGGGGSGSCDNTCRYANDGECDDGSQGGTQYCELGTDSNDCGGCGGGPPPPPACDNTCRYANDGECDDGSQGGTQYCNLGTDSNDCGGCGGGTSGPSPPAPTVNPCPSGERDCGKREGCGWCISNGWDSGCIPGGDMGALDPLPDGDCDRGYTAGHTRAPGSMCVTVMSDDDVRCYQDCQYGNMENFIVPDQATCMSYDTAFKSHTTPFSQRAQVYEHVASHLITTAVGKIGLASGGCTRDTMSSALSSMESAGLEKLEEGGCDLFTDGVGAEFCHEVFSSRFGSWLNGKVTSSSIVQQFNDKLVNTVTSEIPQGYLSKIDTVCEAYHDVQAVANAADGLRSRITEAGAALAQAHFGYSASEAAGH